MKFLHNPFTCLKQKSSTKKNVVKKEQKVLVQSIWACANGPACLLHYPSFSSWKQWKGTTGRLCVFLLKPTQGTTWSTVKASLQSILFYTEELIYSHLCTRNGDGGGSDDSFFKKVCKKGIEWKHTSHALARKTETLQVHLFKFPITTAEKQESVGSCRSFFKRAWGLIRQMMRIPSWGFFGGKSILMRFSPNQTSQNSVHCAIKHA